MTTNAKKGISSHQLAHDLGLNQKTACFMQTRIRAEMASKHNVLLQGVIETDETYVGGKPRGRGNKSEGKPAKRGRGTNKTTVIGAVEKGGPVVAEPTSDLSGRDVLSFILLLQNVKTNKTRLILTNTRHTTQ